MEEGAGKVLQVADVNTLKWVVFEDGRGTKGARICAKIGDEWSTVNVDDNNKAVLRPCSPWMQVQLNNEGKSDESSG